VAELLILGSGTGLPHRKRSPSGYLISSKGVKMLLDSGAGTLQRLFRCRVTHNDIDYILYSHMHPDHILDLASILFAARNPRNARRKDLRIFGPKGLEDFYNKLLSLYGDSILPESYKVIIAETEDAQLNLGSCKVFFKPVRHSAASIAFRIEAKNAAPLTYSGDTDYCENIISLSKESGLLLLECSFPDEYRTKGHLTPSLAGRIATESFSKKLVLTHLYPICDEYPILKQCRKYFKGKIFLARDYMRLKL